MVHLSLRWLWANFKTCIGESNLARAILELAPAISTCLKPTHVPSPQLVGGTSSANPPITTADLSTSSSHLLGIFFGTGVFLQLSGIAFLCNFCSDFMQWRVHPSRQPCFHVILAVGKRLANHHSQSCDCGCAKFTNLKLRRLIFTAVHFCDGVWVPGMTGWHHIPHDWKRIRAGTKCASNGRARLRMIKKWDSHRLAQNVGFQLVSQRFVKQDALWVCKFFSNPFGIIQSSNEETKINGTRSL